MGLLKTVYFILAVEKCGKERQVKPVCYLLPMPKCWSIKFVKKRERKNGDWDLAYLGKLKHD